MARSRSKVPNKVKVFAARVASNQFDAEANISWNDSQGNTYETNTVFTVHNDQLCVKGLERVGNANVKQVREAFKAYNDARFQRKNTTSYLEALSAAIANLSINSKASEYVEENTQDTSQSSTGENTEGETSESEDSAEESMTDDGDFAEEEDTEDYTGEDMEDDFETDNFDDDDQSDSEFLQ